MITGIIIYFLIGLILLSFFTGLGVSQSVFTMSDINWFKFAIVLLLYPIVFLILIVETIGEQLGKKYK